MIRRLACPWLKNGVIIARYNTSMRLVASAKYATSSSSATSYSSGREPAPTSKFRGPPRAEIVEKFNPIHEALLQSDANHALQLFEKTFDPSDIHEFLGTTIPHRLFRLVISTKSISNDKVQALFFSYIDYGIKVGWMCSELMLRYMASGNPEKALETWVKFLEALGSTNGINFADNREAATAALVAYIYNCVKTNQPVSAEVAHQLVPLKNTPDVAQVQNLRGFKNIDKNDSAAIIDALIKLRLDTLDPGDPDFLSLLPTDRQLELEAKYQECVLKAQRDNTVLPERTYARFIQCFAECNRYQKAFDIWNDLINSGVVPNIDSWNSLLRAAALSREDRIAVSEGIWSKIVDSGVKPNADSYSILMDLYFKNRQPERAAKVFEQLQSGSLEVKPNLRVFNVMLHGLLSHGKEKEAILLLEQGLEKDFTPDIITFNSFIKTYIKSKKYEEAEALLDKMKELSIEPDVITYTNFIDTIFKVSSSRGASPDEAITKLLKDMSRKGIKSNTSTITAIIDGLIKTCEDIEAARKMFDIMLLKRIRPNIRTLTTLIDGEVKIGSPQYAISLFEDIPKYNLFRSTVSYNQLIHGLVNRGMLKEGLQFYDRLVKDPKVHANRYTYAFLLRACMNSNALKEAQSIVDDLSMESDKMGFGEALPGLLIKLSDHRVEVPQRLLAKANDSVRVRRV